MKRNKLLTRGSILVTKRALKNTKTSEGRRPFVAFASRVGARALSILSPLSLRACMRTESCNLFLLCSAAVLSRFIYPPSDPSSEQRGVTFNQHLGPRLAGHGLQTKWRKQRSSYFTLDLLLHSLHLIPCNILPAINHVDECSLFLCPAEKGEREQGKS